MFTCKLYSYSNFQLLNVLGRGVGVGFGHSRDDDEDKIEQIDSRLGKNLL